MPAIAVSFHLGIAAESLEVVVAGIVQLAASARELEALGLGVLLPPNLKPCKDVFEQGDFFNGHLPVCCILGLPFAPDAAVAAVGGVMQQSVFPRHLRDHLVQVPEAPVRWGQAWWGHQWGSC